MPYTNWLEAAVPQHVKEVWNKKPARVPVQAVIVKLPLTVWQDKTTKSLPPSL